MRALFLLALLFTFAACSKDPQQREVQFRIQCFECNVEWSTSVGNSGNFTLIGTRNFSTMVDEDGYFSIQACAPAAFTIPPPFDTLAYVETRIDGTFSGSDLTLWIDSCAAVGASVPKK
jgi:hypothetical protein